MNRQKLFNYMSEQHGVTLLEQDMHEIESFVLEDEAPKLTKDNFDSLKDGDRFTAPFYSSQIPVEFKVTTKTKTHILARQYSNDNGLIGNEVWFWVNANGYIKDNKYG